jgi:hypothetical protein
MAHADSRNGTEELNRGLPALPASDQRDYGGEIEVKELDGRRVPALPPDSDDALQGLTRNKTGGRKGWCLSFSHQPLAHGTAPGGWSEGHYRGPACPQAIGGPRATR